MADAFVNGAITDGTKSIEFSAEASCLDDEPVGSFSGSISNIFMGGPVLEDFTFASATPLLLGVSEVLNLIHIVFDNVTVVNTTSQELYTGSTGLLTVVRETATKWQGSVTLLFGTHVLTFFGLFTGSTAANASKICQQFL